MKKVYIAGKLNADAPNYIKNLHIMIEMANQIRRMGFSVFIPGLDFLAGLVDGDMVYSDYFDNNVPWILSSDAIYVCENYKDSSGANREIDIANKNNIPVFYATGDLMDWGYND